LRNTHHHLQNNIHVRLASHILLHPQL